MCDLAQPAELPRQPSACLVVLRTHFDKNHEQYSLTQQPIKMKLGTHILFNEHTKIIMLNIVVNNVVLVKQQ